MLVVQLYEHVLWESSTRRSDMSRLRIALKLRRADERFIPQSTRAVSFKRLLAAGDERSASAFQVSNKIPVSDFTGPITKLGMNQTVFAAPVGVR